MKSGYAFMTAVALIALIAGAHRQHQAPAQTERTAAAAVSPAAPAQAQAAAPAPAPAAAALSELADEGLAAVNAFELARLAMNDGQLKPARKLLDEGRRLLGEVRQREHTAAPGNTWPAHAGPGGAGDLVPILSTVDVVEVFQPVEPSADAAAGTRPAHANSARASTPAPAATEGNAAGNASGNAGESGKPTGEALAQARGAAITKAREHLRQGQPKAAGEALALVDIKLIERQVQLPLKRSAEHAARASRLLKHGEVYAANLELKKIEDELVMVTTVVNEPVHTVLKQRAAQPSR